MNFAIVRDFNLSEEIFNKTHLYDDELVFITYKDNPLSKYKSVSLLDISDENFILLGPKSGIYEKCINEFNKNCLSLNITSTYTKVETILGLVKENFGSTLIMKKVLNSFDLSNIVIIPIKTDISIGLSLVTNKNKSLSNTESLFKEFLISYSNKKIPETS